MQRVVERFSCEASEKDHNLAVSVSNRPFDGLVFGSRVFRIEHGHQ